MQNSQPAEASELFTLLDERKLWPTLLHVAIDAALAGGMAAMGFYREAWQPATVLAEPNALTAETQPAQFRKNPSTRADLQATARILQMAHALLAPIVDQLPGCPITYLGEETEYTTQLRASLSQPLFDSLRSPDKFFDARQTPGLRVIFDGIDGTGSFTRGLPLFCSAVAILVADQARVSAIYDPVHHVVYTALLPGPCAQPEQRAEVSAWDVATGARVDLVERARRDPQRELSHEAIGIHLTRSNPAKLHSLFQIPTAARWSKLEQLASASGGIYALGSGLIALAQVANGALGGFVNSNTNLWDVAAGDVLVRACGGTVTDFAAQPIRYYRDHLRVDGQPYAQQVSLLAAKHAPLHAQLLALVGDEKAER